MMFNMVYFFPAFLAECHTTVELCNSATNLDLYSWVVNYAKLCCHWLKCLHMFLIIRSAGMLKGNQTVLTWIFFGVSLSKVPITTILNYSSVLSKNLIHLVEKIRAPQKSLRGCETAALRCYCMCFFFFTCLEDVGTNSLHHQSRTYELRAVVRVSNRGERGLFITFLNSKILRGLKSLLLYLLGGSCTLISSDSFQITTSQLVSLWKFSHLGYKKLYCHFYSCQISKSDIGFNLIIMVSYLKT